MNTQALHQLFNTAMSMFDHAIATLNDMRALSINAAAEEELPEEEIKRRRRLRAMRWSLVLGVSYAGYKIMRRWLMRRRELRNMIMYAAGGGVGGAHDAEQRQLAYSPYASSHPPPAGYSGGPGYDSSSMMYMGDGGYGGAGRGYQGYGGYGDAHSSSYRYGSHGYGNRGGSEMNYDRGGGAGYFPGY